MEKFKESLIFFLLLCHRLFKVFVQKIANDESSNFILRINVLKNRYFLGHSIFMQFFYLINNKINVKF